MSDPIEKAYWWLEAHKSKHSAVIETRVIAELLRHIEKERQESTADIASEMNCIIRKITMEVNGDDEPAFLDDAVRQAIANAVAAERREIVKHLLSASEMSFKVAKNERSKWRKGMAEAYQIAAAWIEKRGPTKPPAG